MHKNPRYLNSSSWGRISSPTRRGHSTLFLSGVKGWKSTYKPCGWIWRVASHVSWERTSFLIVGCDDMFHVRCGYNMWWEPMVVFVQTTRFWTHYHSQTCHRLISMKGVSTDQRMLKLVQLMTETDKWGLRPHEVFIESPGDVVWMPAKGSEMKMSIFCSNSSQGFI